MNCYEDIMLGRVMNNYIFSYEDPKGNIIFLLEKDNKFIISINNQEVEIDYNSIKVMIINLQLKLWKK